MKKRHGHYCKVCGEYRASEKFSGRGRGSHICKRCMSLPLDERNANEKLTKINRMEFRELNESELKWLRRKAKDSNAEIREAASAVLGINGT